MGTQAFLYNAIFFTFGLMLTTFFGVDPKVVGLFLIPFAVGNYLGPLLLGRLFDRLGRRVMIPATFLIAGAFTIVTGWLFAAEVIDSTTWITVAWVVIFFFASAGASAGYLTVSETFPLEIRAMAIAFFYAIATGIGGGIGPYLYGSLIASNNRWTMFYGYVIGGGLMIGGGAVHRWLGVEAAEESLEDIAEPLSAEAGGDGETTDRARQQRPSSRRVRSLPVRRRAIVSGLPTGSAAPAEDRDLEREVDVLSRALNEDGPAGRRELAQRVRARYWGPGRFSRALHTALREGRVRRRGGSAFEAG